MGGPDLAGGHARLLPPSAFTRPATTHNRPARQPRPDPCKSGNVTLATGLERGPGPLEHPPATVSMGPWQCPQPWPQRSRDGADSPLPQVRSRPTDKDGREPCPRLAPTDKAHVLPIDCPGRQPVGQEPPSLEIWPGGSSEQGLLQGCETPGPCGSPSLGRGRLPGSPESTAGVAQGVDPLAEQ